MIYLRQSTASQEVPLGIFVDETDGVTPLTALSIANTDIRVWKTGATAYVNKTSGGGTHIETGEYYCVLDATDTNTLGPLKLKVQMSGALPVSVICCVLPANIYDSMVLGTDLFDVSVTQWLGTAAATPTVAGVPEVDITHVNGVAQTSSFNTLREVLRALTPIDGTIGATGNDTTHLHLSSLPNTYGDDELSGLAILWFDVSLGEYHLRYITDWVASSELATLDTALPNSPQASTDLFWILAVSLSNQAAAVRTNFATELGRLDAAVTTRASQTSVDDLPTNAELATALAGADDAVLAAIAALNNLSEAGVRTAVGLASANLDTQLGDLPTNSELATALAGADDAVLAAIAALNNLSAAGVRSAIGLASANLDTQLAAAQAILDGLRLANGTIGSTGNDTTHLHLDGLTYGDDEINNSLIVILDVSTGEYHARWIEDWTDTGDLVTVATLPFTPEDAVDQYWILPTRQDVTGGSGLDAAGVRAAIGLASANLDTQLGDLPTNGELATALASADDAVLAAIAALNNLSAAGVRSAIGLASANLDTQLGDLPTYAELAAALGTADDAVLAAIAALNNLSAAGVRSAVGLASSNLDTQLGDLPTNAELATALGTADDAVLAAIAALNNLSAAGVRSAIGLASANLDTQLGDLPTNAELATALGTADDAVLAAIAALNNLSAAGVRSAIGLASANLDTQLEALPTAAENAAALLDLADGVETGLTVRQHFRLEGATHYGKASGLNTTNAKFRDINDTKDRISATVDSSGNRTAVTRDAI